MIADDVFLNCSGKHLFYADHRLPVGDYHSPYCLLMVDDNTMQGRFRDTTAGVISNLEQVKREAGRDWENPYSYLLTDDQGRLMHTNRTVHRSFHNPNVRYRTIEVHATKSFKVPKISDKLFEDFGYQTAEFDIPYRERALIDLQADNELWIFDTGGEVKTLDCIAYDIESSKYNPDQIIMNGWAEFQVKYRAKRDPETGRCEFEMVEAPDWRTPDIVQEVYTNKVEELKGIVKFLRIVKTKHIVAGHNVMAYDNRQVFNRLKWYKEEDPDTYDELSDDDKEFVDEWLRDLAKPTNVFFYGDMLECVDWFPLTFDTYFASKRIYFFLPEYNLKFLAKNFKYIIEDRVYISANEISIDTEAETQTTLKYNEHDVREQLGLTLHLLGDCMRLSHLTGMAFNDINPAGTTKIWDWMTFIRSRQNHRIMPAMASALSLCEEIFHRFGVENPKTRKPWTKKEMADESKRLLGTTKPLSNKLMKLFKYGIEAPDYVQYPHLIYNPYNKETMHIITSRHCTCKDCREQVIRASFDMKNCTCKFCEGLRRQFPEGLELHDRESLTNFVMSELRGAGHPEPDDELKHFILSGRGYREKKIGFHFPGGMTLHPDWENVQSHLKFWWRVVIADVGAMYPSNLRAEGIGGDTTRFADPRNYVIDGDSVKPRPTSANKFSDETYKWVWLKRCRYDILKNFFVFITAADLHEKSKFKKLSKEFAFVDDGYLIAVVIDNEEGGVSGAMRAVLDITDFIKAQKFEMAKPDSGATDTQKAAIKNTYQSMKGLRNSGSVDASRSIMLMSPDGLYRNLNIVEFYDTFKEDVILKEVNGVMFEIKNIAHLGWKGVTVSDNGTVELKPVVNVMRHIYEGDMVYTSTKSGESIITPNHSIYAIKDGEIVHSEPLKTEMPVGLLNVPACSIDVPYLNMLDYLPDDYYVIIDLTLPWSDKAKALFSKGRAVRNREYRVDNYYGQYFKWKIVDIKERLSEFTLDELRMLKVGTNAREGATIPVIIDIDEELADLVGFFLAEGWISTKKTSKEIAYGRGVYKYWSITNVESDIIEKYADIIERKFGIVPYIISRTDRRYKDRKPNITLSIHSLAYAFLFEEVLKSGSDAKCKRIPSLFLNGPDNIKKALLNGMVRGDGSVIERRASPQIYKKKTANLRFDDGKYFQYTSSSYDMIGDIRLLLFQLGIVNTIYCDYRRQNPSWRVSNVANERPCKSELLGNVVAMPIKKQYIVKPTTDYVYDLEMEGNHNFVDSSGMLLENTHGILVAPTVSCRQFSLSGGARITTLGQEVLQDCLHSFDKIGARTIYGDSVTGDTLLWLNDNDENCLKRIDKLWVDSLVHCGGTLRKGENEYRNLYNMKTATLDEQGKLVWKPVEYITRHRYKGRLIKIRTVQGDITVTPQHSLFERIGKTIDAGQLSIDDEIVAGNTDSLRLGGDKDEVDYCQLPIKKVESFLFDGYVYDIEVEDTHCFFDATSLILAHNTDGIYTACSKDAGSVENVKKLWELEDGDCFVDPTTIEQSVLNINSKWQERLDYPDYALDLEYHDGMVLVKHKNYLTFDVSINKETREPEKLNIGLKGNNFKAKDKPKITRDSLMDVMRIVAKRHIKWDTEDEEMRILRSDIKGLSREYIEGLDFESIPVKDLTMTQRVGPPSSYAEGSAQCPNCLGYGEVASEDADKKEKCKYCRGSGTKLSVYAGRANAIEIMTGKKLLSTLAISCVVCNNPLPFITAPCKSDSKPIAYMWPVDYLETPEGEEMCGGVDYDWYKHGCFAYIKGAFGFDEWFIDPWVCLKKQMTLDGSFIITVSMKNSNKKLSYTISDTDLVKDLKKGEDVPDDIMEVLMSLDGE